MPAPAYLSSDAETIAGLRVAALLGTAGAAYGCFGALFRSQPRWLPAVLAVETGWLAIQLVAALVDRVGGRAGRAGWAGGAAGGAGSTLVLLMMLAVGVQLAQIVTAIALLAHGVRRARPRRTCRRAARSLALLRRALPFAASGIVANVQTRVGPLMLGYLSTPAELGLFAAASRFGSVARLAPQAVFAGALPVLSHEHGRDRASAERVFQAFDAVLLGASAARRGRLRAVCGAGAAAGLRRVRSRRRRRRWCGSASA